MPYDARIDTELCTEDNKCAEADLQRILTLTESTIALQKTVREVAVYETREGRREAVMIVNLKVFNFVKCESKI